ncbi:MAG: PLP-dependent transferase [Myxococcota bacterium]
MSPQSHPPRECQPCTQSVRSGIASDPTHGAVAPPLYLSSNFCFEGLEAPRSFDYTRSGNPTRAELEQAIARLEGGGGASGTGSGMAAVTLALHAFVTDRSLRGRRGKVIAQHDSYGGTHRLLTSLAEGGLFDLRFLDLSSPEGLDALDRDQADLIWVETPSNPLLRVTDIEAVAERAGDARVLVDNTFLSPALQNPLALGADLVLHSTTKSLNGHSDIVGGALVAKTREDAETADWWCNCLGLGQSPFDSYLVLRGMRTLHARWAVHERNANLLAERLVAHPAVERVYYPGLRSHPGHGLARRQQRGFGAIISLEIAGGKTGVRRLVEDLELFCLAESLGGVESLVSHPATMTHAAMDPEARRRAGITDGLVRLAVGIEAVEDLVADIERGLERVRRAA